MCNMRVSLRQLAYTSKNLILRVFWGIFRLWCLLESFSWLKYISNSAKIRSKGVIELKIWILQVRCFFSGFHEVSTCDEIMGKWSQTETCVIFNYNTPHRLQSHKVQNWIVKFGSLDHTKEMKVRWKIHIWLILILMKRPS